MAKIIGIGGEPGTGKTSLVKKFLEFFEWEIKKPVKLLDCLWNQEHNIYVLGKYDGEGYAQGTDRLSMAVQPEAVKFVDNMASGIILFEGDRLFNNKFLMHLNGIQENENLFMILRAKVENLQERYRTRGSTQSDKFLQGRETKYNNILSNLMLDISEEVNDTKEDQEKIIKKIQSFCFTS